MKGELATEEFKSSNFAAAFFFLPKEEREALQLVYTYCRILDDIVDEPGVHADKRRQLREWQEELDNIFSGRPLTPLGKALQQAVRRFRLSREPFQKIIDGCTMDLERDRYETFDDLYVYCTKVASAVGQSCIEIFGYENVKTRDYAEHLGVALQLTNILRDVGEDARMGRIYIPRRELDQHGVQEADILSGKRTPAMTTLFEQFARRAEDYYARAEREKQELEPRRLIAAEIMGAIYHRVLRKIVESGYDVLGKPLKLSAAGKLAALTGVLWHHYILPEAA